MSLIKTSCEKKGAGVNISIRICNYFYSYVRTLLYTDVIDYYFWIDLIFWSEQLAITKERNKF